MTQPIGGATIDLNDLGLGQDDPNDDGPEGDSTNEGTDDGEIKFATRADFVKAVNGIVKDRLKRVEKKYAPVVQERDTLKTRVEELENSAPDAEKSQREFDKLQQKIAELENYRKTTERMELVRRIAKDKGLPESLIARVRGDDEDDIASDIEDLLGSIPTASPAGSTTTTTSGKPQSKDEAKGGKKGTSGSGDSDDADVHVDISKIPRYGQPYIAD